MYFIAIFLSSFPLKSLTANAVIYLTMATLFVISTVLLYTRIKASSRFLESLIYGLNLALLAFATYIGTVNGWEFVAVTYMVLMVALPLLTLGRPWIMEGIVSLATVAFGILCYNYKTGAVRQMDLINLVCFWFIAFAINTLLGAQRMRGMLSRHDVEADTYRDALTRVKNTNAARRLQ